MASRSVVQGAFVIRSNDTEYVRREVPSTSRDAAEVGRVLVLALEKHDHLRREKARMLDEFRREEEALGAEIAALIREQKGEPVKRHEDLLCEVWYDLEHNSRTLLTDVHEFVSERPMTPQERQQAEALAKDIA